MQYYFRAFYFGEFKPHNSNTRVMTIEGGTVSIFTPFNFAGLLSSQNSWNKGHVNINGLTVYALSSPHCLPILQCWMSTVLIVLQWFHTNNKLKITATQFRFHVPLVAKLHHFREVFSSQCRSLVLKKLNLAQQKQTLVSNTQTL